MGFFDKAKTLFGTAKTNDTGAVADHAGDEVGKCLLFTIEGKGRRHEIKGKQRDFVTVYEDSMRIVSCGDDDTLTKDDIFDIYILEPITKEIDVRTTHIDFYENGEDNTYDLDDKDFPGLSEQMERVLKKEWRHILERRDSQPVFQWFNACLASFTLVTEKNPWIFGHETKEPNAIRLARETLHESWSINNKADLLRMLESLLAGRSAVPWRDLQKMTGRERDECFDDDEERKLLFAEISRQGGENCLWAWDLQRAILLCKFGYACSFLTRAEALDWGVRAGQKLQKLFRSWDDYMDAYLLGYCWWAEESQEDEESEAYERRYAYEACKKMRQHPWQIRWNLPLTQ